MRTPCFIVFLVCIALIGALPGGEEAVFPLDFEDSQGRQIRLEQPPRRIVSLNPGNNEILLALGRTDLLAGIDRYSNGTRGLDGIRNLGSLFAPSFELIVELQPDLVLLTELSLRHRPKLESLGLLVVALDPYELEGVFATIGLLGRIVEREDQARALVLGLRRRVEQVRRRAAHQEVRPKVFVEIWPQPLLSAGPKTFVHQLIETAGGTNIASDALSDWPQFSLEALVERNPDVILTPSEHSRRELTEGRRPQWATISAVKTGRVYLIDQDTLARPGPRLIDVLETIADLLHPPR